MQKLIAHDYQKYCISRCITDNKLGLFLDMGLGKTVITLTAINDLKYNRFEINKTLVIAPKKVAEDTWVREKEKWEHLQMLKVIPVLGNVNQRIRAINTPGDIFVISRDNVKWLAEYYKSDWPFDMVVIDELSSFKNHASKRFKALKLIRGKIKRVVGLTGTPIPNGLPDLWSQIYLLDQGERLGKTITQYRQTYLRPSKMGYGMVYEYKPKDGAENIVQERIKDICISLSANDYLKLPDRIDDIKYVDMGDKALKQYKEFERDMLLKVKNGEEIDAVTAAALSNKLLQFCNGAVYDEEHNYTNVHDAKIECLDEMLEELRGQPVLIFYNYQHDLERLKNLLGNLKLNVGYLKTKADIARWNNKELDVLLAHPASAAYGLNLQEGGNHIIWFGLNWSLELYKQACARLHRQGQTSKVFVHHIIAKHCLDEEVMDRLQQKDVNQNKLLELLKARINKSKEEEE